MADHLLLVDASGFIHRAFASQQNVRHRESDGFPTGAVLGFTALLWRMMGAAESDRPTLGAAIFDHPGKTFRHKLWKGYKANRAEKPEALLVQLPVMRHAADTLGITPLECAGFEADDVLATLAHRARKAGIRTTIVSTDKDLLQMVDDGKIEVVDPVYAKGRILRADVIKKFGVPPERMRDFQALRGDDVDNIPGIPGCGDERAAALVRRFGSYKDVLKNADLCRWPQVRAQLKRRAADAHLSYKLATLRTNVPLDIDLQALTMPRPQISHLKELLKWLEAPLMFEAIFNLDPQLARPFDHDPNPFAWWREELKVSGQRIPDLPQCGFYQRRLVQGGAFVPARIWREPEIDLTTAESTGRDVLLCEVGGRRRDPFSEWSRLAMSPVLKQSEYEFEVADADHARRYRPDDPKSDPRRKFDILKAKPPHSPKPLHPRRKKLS